MTGTGRGIGSYKDRALLALQKLRELAGQAWPVYRGDVPRRSPRGYVPVESTRRPRRLRGRASVPWKLSRRYPRVKGESRNA